MNLSEISLSMMKAQDEMRNRGILPLPKDTPAEVAKLYPMTAPIACTAKVVVGKMIIVE